MICKRKDLVNRAQCLGFGIRVLGFRDYAAADGVAVLDTVAVVVVLVCRNFVWGLGISVHDLKVKGWRGGGLQGVMCLGSAVSILPLQLRQWEVSASAPSAFGFTETNLVEVWSQ